jgi:NADPH:quinone reductase-like Zn-dependent oxidoreductase
MERLAANISLGNIKAEIHQVLPLADIKKAHDLAQKGGISGKIVLQVSDDATKKAL